MWIDFKPIYNTLEREAIFVRGLRPKTSRLEQLTATPDLPAEPNSLCLG